MGLPFTDCTRPRCPARDLSALRALGRQRRRDVGNGLRVFEQVDGDLRFLIFNDGELHRLAGGGMVSFVIFAGTRENVATPEELVANTRRRFASPRLRQVIRF